MKGLRRLSVCLMLVATLFMGLTPVSHAKSYEMFFNLKPGQRSSGFAAKKAGGDNFENKYYVTQLSTDPDTDAHNGKFSYYTTYQGKKVGNTLTLKMTDHSKHSKSYKKDKAVSGRTYKLSCGHTGDSPKKYANGVSGRWTP